MSNTQLIASKLFCGHVVNRNYYRAKEVECSATVNHNLEYVIKDEVMNEIITLNRMIDELKKYGIEGQILTDLTTQLDDLENAWEERDEFVTTAANCIRVIN